MSDLATSSEPARLVGRRFALVGKFAGMSKREAQKLIRQQHGTVCDRPDPSVNFVVLGEAELPLGGDLGSDDWLNEQLQEATESGTLSVIGETELWQMLGLATKQQDADIRNLYTSAMLAELLGVPTATVRRWHRRGLICPRVEIRRLAYFDFQEVVNARALASLLAEGISPVQLERKLESLARFLPGVQRRIAQLTVIVEGQDILLRQGDGLIDAGGQMRIDFDVPLPTAAATRASDDSVRTVSLATTDVAGESDGAGVEQLTAGEMVSAAALLEDDEQLGEAATVYRAALAAYGPDAEVHFRLAELLYRLGDVTAARERYYAAIELDEDYVEARANLGCVLSELGEMDLAIAAWDGALKFHPGYADVHLHMARTLDELERTDEATRHWDHFLSLAPDSPWAEEGRRRLDQRTAAEADGPPPEQR